MAVKTHSDEVQLPVVMSATLALSLSDDECIERLTQIIGDADDRNLPEAAALIARLAVVIE